MEEDSGHGRHPDHAHEGRKTRSRRSRPRPDRALRRAPQLSGQYPVLGQSGCGHEADRPPSRHAFHPRPSRHITAARAARAGTALGGPAEGAGARQAKERRDQGEWRLTLSKAPYPFPDIWDPLKRVFDAWGLERCLWGTDWTRAFAVVNYEQAVKPFLETKRLSDSERAMLMGGACAKAYGWSPKKG